MFRATEKLLEYHSNQEPGVDLGPDDVEIVTSAPENLESAHPGRWEKPKAGEMISAAEDESDFIDMEVVTDVPDNLESANAGRWERAAAHEAEVEATRKKAFEAYDKTPPQESTISGTTFSWNTVDESASSENEVSAGMSESNGFWSFMGKAFSWIGKGLVLATVATVGFFDILIGSVLGKKNSPSGK